MAAFPPWGACSAPPSVVREDVLETTASRALQGHHTQSLHAETLHWLERLMSCKAVDFSDEALHVGSFERSYAIEVNTAKDPGMNVWPSQQAVKTTRSVEGAAAQIIQP